MQDERWHGAARCNKRRAIGWHVHLFAAGRKRSAEFLALMSQTDDELSHVYEDAAAPEQKRAASCRDRTAADALSADARQALGWILGVRCLVRCADQQREVRRHLRYSDGVPAFLRLLDLCSGDYPRFYAYVRRIGALDEAYRAEALKAADTCD